MGSFPRFRFARQPALAVGLEQLQQEVLLVALRQPAQELFEVRFRPGAPRRFQIGADLVHPFQHVEGHDCGGVGRRTYHQESPSCSAAPKPATPSRFGSDG